jgi:hypothetical protein
MMLENVVLRVAQEMTRDACSMVGGHAGKGDILEKKRSSKHLMSHKPLYPRRVDIPILQGSDEYIGLGALRNGEERRL